MPDPFSPYAQDRRHNSNPEMGVFPGPPRPAAQGIPMIETIGKVSDTKSTPETWLMSACWNGCSIRDVQNDPDNCYMAAFTASDNAF